MSKILCLSSSSLGSFLNCRKAYDLTWHRGLEPFHESEAIEKGTNFHEHAAAFADFFHHGQNEEWKKYCNEHASDPMLTIWRMYRKHHWDIQPEQILFSSATGTTREHSLHLPLVKTGGYDVWIRFTCDLIYRDNNGWINVDDYKTFSSYPSSQNSDLDFQGRGAIAIAQRYFESDQVQFKWRYVRSVPPGSPRGTGPWEWDGRYWFKLKNGKKELAEVWKVDECYPPEGDPAALPLVCSRSESDEMWKEMQDAAKDLVRAMREDRWYRTARRGTMPYTCHSCLAKYLCKAEMAAGTLDEETIAGLTRKRDPIVVPDADLKRWKRRIPKTAA